MSKVAYWVRMLAVVMLLSILGAGCTPKMKESYHLRRANIYFDSGQYDQAVIEYKNVLQNNQQNAQAWSRLGIIYCEQGRLGEAAQVLGRARQLSATNLEVRLKLGAIYLNTGRLQDACDEVGFVLEEAPRNPQAPILLAQAVTTNQIAETRLRLQKMSQSGETAPLDVALGTLAFRQFALKAAEVWFNNAVKLDPKFSDAYSALGTLYAAQNEMKRADRAFQTAAALAPTRSGKALQYAQFKIVTGDQDAGKHLLEEIVKKTPDYLPAWIALAQLAAVEKKYTDGITLLGNVLSRDPQNLEGLLLKGHLELLQGETAKAVSDLGGAARMFPQVSAVHFQLALARLANNETDKAIENLNQAVSLNPKYADAIMLLAEIQIRNRNIASAIASLEQLIQQQPQILPARFLLAEAFRAQGRMDTAVQIYREVEKAYPDNPQPPFLLGTALLQQMRNSEARVEFDQALKLAPNYLPALEQAVNLDLMEKQYATAQQRVQQQIARNPQEPALQLLLAKVLAARGDTSQAESTLLSVIKLQPDSQPAYLMLAQLYTAANQNQKALAKLQAALARNPKDLDALMLMAVIYNAGQDYKDARDAYEKLLALAPNNGVVMNNLAYLYAENLGQLDKAYEMAHQARDLAFTDPSIADTFGWILYRKGQYASALSLLRESAAKLDDVPEAQFHLGMTYYQMGDEANARTVFQRALQCNQDFPEKNECKQCLAVLAIDAKTPAADVRPWLEKRVANQPHDAVALLRLATIYQRENSVDKAIATYEAALQANPQNVAAMVNLARLYPPQDVQKAFNLAKAAYNLAPNDPLVSHTLGRLAFLTGDYNWSLSLLQLTAQAQPQNPEVMYDLGLAQYRLKNLLGSKASLQRALELNLSGTEAVEASQILADLKK